MAEQERKILLKVETGESQKTVKSLKQDISDLKDAILNLEQGTDEYNAAVQELQAAQRDLNRVQSLTKETAVALEGSYDALTHQMSLLKKEWKATNDEAQRNELAKQIDEINDKLKEMDATTGNFQRNVGNYQSALQGVNVEQKTFNERMGEMREEIEPTKMKFESIGNIASGVASGFAAVQGVMALLGVESKDFEKTLIKLQAAMAIAQGIGGLQGLVEGVGKAKVAFQGLNTTIKMVNSTMGKTGWIAIIMAVITAVTLAVTAIRNKRKEVDALANSLDKLDKRNENLIASDKERARQLEREIKLMQAQGASEEEVLNKRLEYNQQYLDASEKIYKEAQKQYLGLKNSLSMGIRGVTQEDVDKAKEVYDAANETFKEYSEKRKDILNDIVIAQINASQKIEKATLQPINIKQPDIELNTDIQLEDEELELETGFDKKAQEQISAWDRLYQRKLEYNRISVEDEETKAQREYEITLELQQNKLDVLRRFQEEAQLNGDVEGALAIAEDIKDAELAIEVTKYDEKQRLREIDEEKERQHQENLKQIGMTALYATADILGSVADMYEADGVQSEKEAKKIKNLRIAEATINTISGAIGAFTSASANIPAPAGIIIGAIQAAAVTAMGIANIAKIKNTDVSLTGGGSGGGASSASVTPNVSSYSSELPASYTRNVTTSSEVDELNKDTRVYILESDIQESNKKVSVRESESSF